MLLDQTRYEAFWANPERYRLAYELNIVPRETPYGLSRGTALHLINEWHHAQLSDAEIDSRLKADPAISEKARLNAWQLWRELERAYPILSATSSSQPVKIAAEVEFTHQIPGSPHGLCGRIDEIIQLPDGRHVVGELKSANARRRYDDVRREWETKKQADFVLLGARSLGYSPIGVMVRVAVEGTPPKVWAFDVTRTERQLSLAMLHVHQTCEIIEFMRRTFGVNDPWPHLTHSWPCAKSGACEHEPICCHTRAELTPDMLDGYAERQEHLELLRR